jgi:hypothetical protein
MWKAKCGDLPFEGPERENGGDSALSTVVRFVVNLHRD